MKRNLVYRIKKTVKRPQRAFFFLVALFLFLGLAREGLTALIDWTKHNDWKVEKLKAIVQEVDLNKKSRYVMLSVRTYDKNRDGFIDENEVEAIRSIVEAAEKKKA